MSCFSFQLYLIITYLAFVLAQRRRWYASKALDTSRVCYHAPPIEIRGFCAEKTRTGRIERGRPRVSCRCSGPTTAPSPFLRSPTRRIDCARAENFLASMLRLVVNVVVSSSLDAIHRKLSTRAIFRRAGGLVVARGLLYTPLLLRAAHSSQRPEPHRQAAVNAVKMTFMVYFESSRGAESMCKYISSLFQFRMMLTRF